MTLDKDMQNKYAAVEVIPPSDYTTKTLDEKLRWLTTVQEKLRLSHNAEAETMRLEEFRKRQEEHWNPRIEKVGGEIAVLRQQKPVPEAPAGEDQHVQLRFNRSKVVKELKRTELDAINLAASLQEKAR